MKSFLPAVVLSLCLTLPASANDIFLTASRHCDYDSALNELTSAISDHNYTVVKIQPVDKGLRHRGYSSPNYKVIFFTNKAQVDRIMKVNPKAAVILPLRIFLYPKGNTVVASAASLKMWKGVFGRELDPMMELWEHDLREILRDFATQSGI